MRTVRPMARRTGDARGAISRFIYVIGAAIWRISTVMRGVTIKPAATEEVTDGAPDDDQAHDLAHRTEHDRVRCHIQPRRAR